MEKNKKLIKAITFELLSKSASELLVKRDLTSKALKQVGLSDEEITKAIEDELELAAESYKEFKEKFGMPEMDISVIEIGNLFK